jgi:hypothetical protein
MRTVLFAQLDALLAFPPRGNVRLIGEQLA